MGREDLEIRPIGRHELEEEESPIVRPDMMIVGSMGCGDWRSAAVQQADACFFGSTRTNVMQEAARAAAEASGQAYGGAGPCRPGRPRLSQIGASLSPAGGIAAGAIVTVTIQVTAPFKGEMLIIPAALAPIFDVVNIFVGPTPVLGQSITQGTGQSNISGEVYSSARLEGGGRLPMPLADTSQLIAIQFLNVSGVNQPTIKVNVEGTVQTPAW